MLAVVEVVVAVVLVAKIMSRDEVVINMLVEESVIGAGVDVLAGMDIIVVAVAAIVLEFVVTVPHSVEVVADVSIDALSKAIIGVIHGICVDIFAVPVTVLEFTISTLLEDFRC